MNRNQRIALAERDLRVKDLGFLLNKHPNYIASVLSGRYRSPELRKKLSNLLGKSEAYLWPEDDNSQY